MAEGIRGIANSTHRVHVAVFGRGCSGDAGWARKHRSRLVMCAAAVLFIFGSRGGWCATAELGPIRTQTIELVSGWNAVFLEVGPERVEPEQVFAGTPVDVAAAYLSAGTPAQFVSDPDADLLRETGWGVWYAADRPDAFLGTLHAIYGQHAYLLHATTNFTWSITGDVGMPDVVWTPSAFTLVGFSVDDRGPPTFATFFAGSSAHRDLRVYRLADGAWRSVVHPDAQPMRAGEAVWVYCNGASDYQGPLRVETTSSRGLILSQGRDDLVLRNTMDHPVTPCVAQVLNGTNTVPLSIVIQAVADVTTPIKQIPVPQPRGTWELPLPPLEAGEAVRVPLMARLEDMTEYEQKSLLKVTTDLGTVTWVPVYGIREDREAR